MSTVVGPTMNRLSLSAYRTGWMEERQEFKSTSSSLSRLWNMSQGDWEVGRSGSVWGRDVWPLGESEGVNSHRGSRTSRKAVGYRQRLKQQSATRNLGSRECAESQQWRSGVSAWVHGVGMQRTESAQGPIEQKGRCKRLVNQFTVSPVNWQQGASVLLFQAQDCLGPRGRVGRVRTGGFKDGTGLGVRGSVCRSSGASGACVRGWEVEWDLSALEAGKQSSVWCGCVGPLLQRGSNHIKAFLMQTVLSRARKIT